MAHLFKIENLLQLNNQKKIQFFKVGKLIFCRLTLKKAEPANSATVPGEQLEWDSATRTVSEQMMLPAATGVALGLPYRVKSLRQGENCCRPSLTRGNLKRKMNETNQRENRLRVASKEGREGVVRELGWTRTHCWMRNGSSQGPRAKQHGSSAQGHVQPGAEGSLGDNGGVPF